MGAQLYSFPDNISPAATAAVTSSGFSTPTTDTPHATAAARVSTPGGQKVSRTRRMSRARSLPKPLHNPWITDDGEVLDLEEVLGDEGPSAGRPSAGAPVAATPSMLSEMSSAGDVSVGTPPRAASSLAQGHPLMDMGPAGVVGGGGGVQYGRGGGGGYGGLVGRQPYGPACSPFASRGPSPNCEVAAAAGGQVGPWGGGWVHGQQMYGSPYQQGGAGVGYGGGGMGGCNAACQQYNPGMVVQGFMNPFQAPPGVSSPFGGSRQEPQTGPAHNSNSNSSMPMFLALASALAASMGLPKVDSATAAGSGFGATPAAATPSSRTGSRAASSSANSGAGSPAAFLSPQASALPHARVPLVGPTEGGGNRQPEHHQQQQFGCTSTRAGSPYSNSSQSNEQHQQHGSRLGQFQRPGSRLAAEARLEEDYSNPYHQDQHHQQQQQQAAGALGVGPLAPSRGPRKSWKGTEETQGRSSSVAGSGPVLSPFAMAASPFAAVPLQQQGFGGEVGAAAGGREDGAGSQSTCQPQPQQQQQRFVSPFAVAQESFSFGGAGASDKSGESGHASTERMPQQQPQQQQFLSPFAAVQGRPASPSRKEALRNSTPDGSSKYALPVGEHNPPSPP
jgi:hypothetical protein